LSGTNINTEKKVGCTDHGIVFPCPMMARTVASTSVVYVFVLPSINFALERTLSTLESKFNFPVSIFIFISNYLIKRKE
jgi:hypothetical protein